MWHSYTHTALKIVWTSPPFFGESIFSFQAGWPCVVNSVTTAPRSHLDHFDLILDHLHVRWGAVARRHDLLSGDFCPYHWRRNTGESHLGARTKQITAEPRDGWVMARAPGEGGHRGGGRRCKNTYDRQLNRQIEMFVPSSPPPLHPPTSSISLVASFLVSL